MADKAIHKNPEIFQFLIKNSFDIITLLDEDGTILFESNATERILGYKSGGRNQHAALDFVHPDDQQIVAKKIQKVASESEGIESVQFRYLHAEGHWIWLEANGQNFLNHSEIEGIIVNAHDITRQKEREHQLQERVKELNCLQQLSQLIETQNSVADLLTEIPAVLKNSWQFPEITEVKITYNDDQYQTAQYTETQWKHKTEIIVNKALQGQIQIVYRENPTTWKNPFLEEEYTLLRIVGERLSHFIEQTEKEKNYAKLFSTLNEGILKTGQDGKITEANQAAAEICGYQYPDELIGKPMASIYINPDSREEFIKEVEKKGDKVQNYEFLVKRKDGSTVWTLSNIRILRNEKGEYAGSLGAYRDVTNYIETQKAIKARNNEIVKLLRGTRIVLESKDFLTTAQKVFDYCREITGAQSGFVALLNENGIENDVIYLEPGNESCNVNPNLPMPIHGLRKVVYQTGETNYDNRYSESPHSKHMPEGHIPLKNVMLAPLKSRDNTIGLLGLGNKETDFTDYDARIAGSFAELISIALANSRNLEQIKESEAKFKALFENANDAIFLADAATGEIVEANSRAEKLLGFSKNEIIGMHQSQLHPESIKKDVRESFKHNLYCRRKISYKELTVINKNKELIPVEISPNIITLAGKQYVYGIFRDISERKKAEQALKESEARYRSIFYDNKSVMLLIDPESGKIKDANKSARAYYGYTGDEMKQLTIMDINMLSKEEIQQEMLHAKKEKRFFFEFTHKLANGEIRDVEVYSGKVQFSTAQLLISIIHDVTAKKKAEKALRENEARLRELNATKDKFFSIISHDLKNPFSAILGASQLALKRIKKDERQKAEKYIRLIYETTQHSVSLLDNLLQWSQLQKGKLKIKPRKVFLADLACDVVNIMEANIKEKHIDAKVEIPADIEIEADPIMIQTTLRNLVSNAVKYSKENGEIRIAAKKHKKAIEIMVEDNGIGIKPEKQNNLFKIEGGYSTLGTNYEKGTGLGLILCKEFVALHGGEIWFESSIEKGTVFYFTLLER
ncbi:MAG TPA: PAS domain S-box protein [Salinivirga sp.]|uniref:PAS domain S-box protein n=1 Tax=Salinivirga sp. TaxID=1970192 RepID=UPI002B463198|nr:PAS domain S-box protein [Salinivirga sp.]HKK60189.1 PAS domain S-box protein [Salinivirga sp.]